MAYRWSLDGPAFEFPTPYTTETRFLRWRGGALLALALLIVVVLALPGESAADRPMLTLDTLPQAGSVWPHVLVALALAALGVWDLLRASRQQMLLLVPGQPASLVVQVRREGSGSSPGAAWLTRALGGGRLAPEPAAAQQGNPGEQGTQAPTSVQACVQLRRSQRVWLAGLSTVLVLAAVLLGPWLLGRPAALSLIALMLALLGAAVVVRQILEPGLPPLPLKMVAVWLGAALLLSLLLAVYADRLPGADKLARLGLPLAVALMLTGGLLLEMLGLLAARANPDLPRPTAQAAADEVGLNLEGSPAQLMRELDLELHRRWPDGVPNRRYVWLPPQVDPALAESPFTATVLEESQPRYAESALQPEGAAAQAAARRRTCLLLLNTLGLLFSVAGGLLWARVAYTHMHDSSAMWTPGTLGVVCLLLGAHALRVAHVLWSRIEVMSTITWLDFQGRCVRLANLGVGADATAWSRNEAPARIESLRLRACVAQVRSVFYAAGGDDIGSRTLLTLDGDAAASQGWAKAVEGLLRNAEPGVRTAVLVPEEVARTATAARDRRAPDTRPAPPPRRPVRFCPECGTPVLQGARFCQHCGSVVGAD